VDLAVAIQDARLENCSIRTSPNKVRVRPDATVQAVITLRLTVLARQELVVLYESAADGTQQAAIKFQLKETAADTGSQNDTDRTPPRTATLHDAENAAAAELLIAAGADVELGDCDGRRPLHTAVAAEGREEVVQVLLNRGADVDSRDHREQTPLHWASYAAAAELLIDSGADVEAEDVDGFTPLQNALYYRHSGVVKVLLDRGALFERRDADVHARDHAGRTSLHSAACNAHWGIDAIELLLSKGAGVNSRDNKQQTPLHLAAKDWIAELLISHNADTAARDVDGYSPLHAAVRDTRTCVVKALLNRDADVDSTDAMQQTPC
jgi:ankyrin repeat protein